MTRLPQLPANELESVDDAGVAFRIMRMKEGPMITKLPATFREAAAMQRKDIAIDARILADDWIARRGFQFFHPNSEEKFGRPMMKEYAQLQTWCAEEVVYFSDRGSQQAHLALREIIAERLDRHEQLGTVLDFYIIRQFNPAQAGRPGPGGPAETFMRDVGIRVSDAETDRPVRKPITHQSKQRRRRTIFLQRYSRGFE